MGWTGVEGGGSFDNWLCASMSFVFFVKCVLTKTAKPKSKLSSRNQDKMYKGGGNTEQALHLANAVHAVPEQPDKIAELRELPKR